MEYSIIVLTVAARLSQRGHVVMQSDERDLESSLSAEKPDFIFSMARLPETLRLLQTSGIKVVNTPSSVEQSSRRRLQELMVSLHLPVPSGEPLHGYWVKRGDSAAQTAEDVVLPLMKRHLLKLKLKCEFVASMTFW